MMVGLPTLFNKSGSVKQPTKLVKGGSPPKGPKGKKGGSVKQPTAHKKSGSGSGGSVKRGSCTREERNRKREERKLKQPTALVHRGSVSELQISRKWVRLPTAKPLNWKMRQAYMPNKNDTNISHMII